MSLAAGKVLLRLAGRRHRVVDAADVYYLEAQRDETDVRLLPSLLAAYRHTGVKAARPRRPPR